MRERLREIETALKERGLEVQFKSIKDLRKFFPKLPDERTLSESDLERLRDAIPIGDFESLSKEFGFNPWAKQRNPSSSLNFLF